MDQELVRIAAKPKRDDTDAAPTKASMRESSAEKIRRNPTTDQRRIRRQMAKTASTPGQLADQLVVLLNLVYTLYRQAHVAHWNVTGDGFYADHQLFETIYDDVYGSVDAIAENVRKLGYPVPADVGPLGIDSQAGTPTDAQVLIQGLLVTNARVLDALGDAFDLAGGCQEEGIANFLSERIDQHQKWAWFLQASLGGGGRTAALQDWDTDTDTGMMTTTGPSGYSVTICPDAAGLRSGECSWFVDSPDGAQEDSGVASSIDEAMEIVEDYLKPTASLRGRGRTANSDEMNADDASESGDDGSRRKNYDGEGDDDSGEDDYDGPPWKKDSRLASRLVRIDQVKPGDVLLISPDDTPDTANNTVKAVDGVSGMWIIDFTNGQSTPPLGNGMVYVATRRRAGIDPAAMDSVAGDDASGSTGWGEGDTTATLNPTTSRRRMADRLVDDPNSTDTFGITPITTYDDFAHDPAPVAVDSTEQEDQLHAFGSLDQAFSKLAADLCDTSDPASTGATEPITGNDPGDTSISSMAGFAPIDECDLRPLHVRVAQQFKAPSKSLGTY